MSVELVSAIVSTVVGLMAIGAVIVRAIIADTRQKVAIEKLTEAVRELTGRMDKMEERVRHGAVRNQKKRRELPSRQHGDGGSQGYP